MFPARHCQGSLFFVGQRRPRDLRSAQGSAAWLCGWALTEVGGRPCRSSAQGPLWSRGVLGPVQPESAFPGTARFLLVSGEKSTWKPQCGFLARLTSQRPCFQQRPPVDEALREGHINLSGLQLRAHAMFSAEGLPLGSDSLEYAWLIDVQAGSLTAKVTAPQVRVSGYCPHVPLPIPFPSLPPGPTPPSSRSGSEVLGPGSAHCARARWRPRVSQLQSSQRHAPFL